MTTKKPGTSSLRSAAEAAVVLVVGVVVPLAGIGCRGGSPGQRTGAQLVRPSSWSQTPAVTHHDLTRVLMASPPEGVMAPSTRASSLLERYLAAAAARGPISRPELFPSDQDALAYLINAHMAWAVALNAASGPSRGQLTDPRGVAFPLDGTMWTLARLSNEILARAPAEPRIILFLNPGFRGGPPLPPVAVEGYSLAWQISIHAQTCGSAPGFWNLDADKGALHVTGFTRFMPALPANQRARTRILLDLVPPPPELRSRILARCGSALQQCTVTLAPVDTQRWRQALSTLSPSGAASARG